MPDIAPPEAIAAALPDPLDGSAPMPPTLVSPVAPIAPVSATSPIDAPVPMPRPPSSPTSPTSPSMGTYPMAVKSACQSTGVAGWYVAGPAAQSHTAPSAAYPEGSGRNQTVVGLGGLGGLVEFT